jgi:hypothetical protein
MFVFAEQAIVTDQRDSIGALADSAGLVMRASFWRTFSTLLLGMLCVYLVVLPLSMLHRAIVLDAVRLLAAPVVLAFTTSMYLLARGERGALESALSGGAGDVK